MNHTQQSISIIPIHHQNKQSIPQPTIISNHTQIIKQQIQKNNLQSGIYIHFQQNQDDAEISSQYHKIQKQYNQYLKQTHKYYPSRNYPINSFKENKLIIIGNKNIKMLCKIKSVYIQQSQISKKLQKQSRKSQQKCNDPVIQKFWEKRYRLFEKFDQGIKLDRQSWFSVTPQAVADHIASKFQGFDTVLDGFCGAGGDSIQIALNCKNVICNDIDKIKIDLLMNNAEVYGVDNIKVLNLDFLDLQFKKNEIDGIYFAPPWGGPQYYKLQKMTSNNFIPSLDKLISKSISISQNIGILLPINFDINNLPQIIYQSYNKQNIIINNCSILIQKIYYQNKFKFILLLIGNKINKINLSDQLNYFYQLINHQEEIFIYKRVIKKIRQDIGMLRLFNIIFQCEKYQLFQGNKYQQLINYLVSKQYIHRDKIRKIQEIDQNQAFKNQNKKQKKNQKKLMKSMKFNNHQQLNNQIRMTYNDRKMSNPISPSKKDRLQVTVSYISSISGSKICDSFNPKQNNLYLDNDQVRIQPLSKSIINQQQKQ